MGEADRYHEYKKPKNRFGLGDDSNALVALFAINVIFFVLMMVIQVGFYYAQRNTADYNNEVVRWLSVPANFTSFSERPWTIFTYVFTDTGGEIIRLISNMIWLWAFGYLLQQMAGNDKLIPIYIYGGLTGGLFFLLSHYIFPSLAAARQSSALLGANTGVLAVAMATTTLSPDHRFFTQIRNGIPIWVLMSIYILIDFAGIASDGAAYSISHLGGALAGFLFIVFLRKGKDGSVWMNNFYFWLTNLFNPYKKPSKEKIKDTHFYETGGRKPFHKTSHITQQRVDEILDKINQKGYHFLTEEEKQILKKAAEEENL
ncbi:MAG: rhomboid family intramembrane serine protease [Sphingobacteriales bacterium]|nr:MAG: rhomboid family intramembrane serine protease [Sphingobacteriales bacterium]